MANDEKEKTNVSQLENYLRELIVDELSKKQIEITEADAKEIVNNMANEIDDFVSRRMKQHFVEIAQFIIKKFGKEKS